MCHRDASTAAVVLPKVPLFFLVPVQNIFPDMKLRVHRTDGRTGSYLQHDARRAEVLSKRFDPQTLFTSGPIVIGVLNPFTLLNADEVCWVEVLTDMALDVRTPEYIDSIDKLAGEAEYKEILARQWLRWTGQSQDQEGDLLEALVEVSFRGGDLAYLHVKGRVTKSRSLPEQIFGVPAIAARIAGGGAFYINPKTIVRARIYHSMGQVEYPMGLWFAEAEDF